MGVKKVIDRAVILAEYLNKKVSMTQACKTIGCCPTTLIKELRRYGLTPKPRTWNRHRTSIYPQLQNREWLVEQLKTRTMLDIANELGTSSGNVSDHVRRYGLRWQHYERMEAVRAGLLKSYPDGRFGSKAANWKGGTTVTGGGHIYRHSPEHPAANKDGYVMDHRLVMEKHLGRLLREDEVVHHKNGIKTDNRIENLEAMTKSEHLKVHFEAVHDLHQARERIAYLEALLTQHGIAFDDHRP